MQGTQGTWVWSLGQENPLEEEMATQSSILAWEIPWTEEPSWLQSRRWQRVGHNWVRAHTWTAGEKWYVTRKGMLPNCWDLWVLPSRTYSTWWVHTLYLSMLFCPAQAASFQDPQPAKPCPASKPQFTCTPPSTLQACSAALGWCFQLL